LPLCRVETADGVLVGLGRTERLQQGGYILRMDKVLAAPQIKAKEEGPPYNVVAIGNFDGVHLGHKELMLRMERQKELLGGPSAVLTFKPHPLKFITGQTPCLLNTAEEKRRLIAENGADALVELRFDEKLRLSGPETFVDEVIAGQTGARRVVVGFNFRFGANGAGDAKLLQKLCAARGIYVEIVEAVNGPYGLVSSSNIRRLLQAGDMAAVNSMLGYTYELSGRVVMGNQLGRKLGFPTANFSPPAGKALPPWGVYAGRAECQGLVYGAVINLGFKPTVGHISSEPLVEAHLLDAQPKLYGELITVYLECFLRPERRFAGLDELKAQISADTLAARSFLQ
ncbi:MAG: bifunctional riboflavin kinase/FAD synthetase, partial [Clostridiales bacterium]|nr:bifunctional riboflavin kinase/FAD synthetase [Clostridiales bacterium]